MNPHSSKLGVEIGAKVIGVVDGGGTPNLDLSPAVLDGVVYAVVCWFSLSFLLDCLRRYILTDADHASKETRREKCPSFTGVVFMITGGIRHFLST